MSCALPGIDNTRETRQRDHCRWHRQCPTEEYEKYSEEQTSEGAGSEQPLELELDVDLSSDVIESVDVVFKKEKFKLPVDKKARFIALQ